MKIFILGVFPMLKNTQNGESWNVVIIIDNIYVADVDIVQYYTVKNGKWKVV